MDCKLIELTEKECNENYGGRLIWVTINKNQGYWLLVAD